MDDNDDWVDYDPSGFARPDPRPMSLGEPGCECSALYKFHLIEPNGAAAWPRARSGHRTFVDNNFLYVIGGYTNNPTDTILRELWRFDLVSHKWTSFTLPADFPHTLASFACHSSGNGTFMVYGGTGVPFGQELDEAIYRGRIVGDSVQIEKILPVGNKPGCYGHVLIFDTTRKATFSIGGTNGKQFKLDVHALRSQGCWKGEVWKRDGVLEWEEYATVVNDSGLYGMEAILDKDRIYIFGGGTTERNSTFHWIQVFNIERKSYEVINTNPDPEHGYPDGRRCHSLVQWGRNVIIAGGCNTDIYGNNVILGCVWSFNLDTNVWSKIADLPVPVSFHDASITADGLMLIFGGLSRTRGRIATVQKLWLGALPSRSNPISPLLGSRPPPIVPRPLQQQSLQSMAAPPNVVSSTTVQMQQARPIGLVHSPQEEPALTEVDAHRYRNLLYLVDEEAFVYATKQLPNVCFSWLLDNFGFGLKYLIEHQATSTKRKLRRRDKTGITHLVESRFKQLQTTFTCAVCFVKYYMRSAISCLRAPGSGVSQPHEKHFFCRNCVRRYAELSVEQASPPILQTTFTCGICFEDDYMDSAVSCVRATGGAVTQHHEQHHFCSECVSIYAENAVAQNNIVRAGIGLKCPSCPDDGVLLSAHVEPLLQGRSRELLEEKLEEAALAAAPIRVERCLREGCSWGEVIERCRRKEKTFTCGKCDYKYCRRCKSEWSARHVGKSCEQVNPEFARRKLENALSQRVVDRLHHCPICKKPIEKNGGCNKMICCDRRIKNKKPRKMTNTERAGIIQQHVAAAIDPKVVAELNKLKIK